MHTLRALIKRCLAYALYYSGLLWFYAALKLRHRAAVLMYHRVLPDSADSFSHSGIIVSPETFALHMSFLRRHFKPLSADEFSECLERRSFPARACLVTFDDGWHDNEKYALPVLQRFDVPAIVFVATGYVGTATTFWQEQMTRLLFTVSRQRASAAQLLAELGISDACDADADKARRIVREFVTRLKLADPDEVKRIGELLGAVTAPNGASGLDFGDDVFMGWDAVSRLASSGLVTIGSHAHTHAPLPRLTREGATAEFRTSRQTIESCGLPTPWMCAYPNGDYDAQVIASADDTGFTVGFTTEHRPVLPGDDPRRLPRINIHESATSSRPEFMCRILGLF